MRTSKLLLSLFAAGSGAMFLWAQTKVWTPQELFTRNVGTKEQQLKQYPPHQIIGNIYYVGSESLGSFLVVTPEGDVLIDTAYEANVPSIKKSVEDLGFKFSDIKIVLGSHAHADHMEGDAMVKEMTGAKVMAMAEDVPALEAMKPGGKAHPIDRVLHDNDEVKLGGTTLVAHLTPGHTHGCTTWSLKVQDAGKTYDVVIIGSMGVNPGFQLVNNAKNPGIADEYERGFKVMHSLKCDVPLGSHPAMYNLVEKHAKLGKGGPNPFIDPEGYKTEIAIEEGAFRGLLAQQQKAAAK
ncbi:MAG TPA: subclass B3 metallo-beta-lactamase [Bryobacteraceae bacterium]|jgi:metallo-beta-lactamase class B